MRGRIKKDSSTDRWERPDWWGVVLEAPDPGLVLRFWSELLEVPIHRETEEGGGLDFGEGVAYLTVQKATVYEPPVWPPEPGKQGMSTLTEIPQGCSSKFPTLGSPASLQSSHSS